MVETSTLYSQQTGVVLPCWVCSFRPHYSDEMPTTVPIPLNATEQLCMLHYYMVDSHNFTNSPQNRQKVIPQPFGTVMAEVLHTNFIFVIIGVILLLCCVLFCCIVPLLSKLVSRSMASFSTGIYVQTARVSLNTPLEGGEDEPIDSLTRALFAKALEKEDDITELVRS